MMRRTLPELPQYHIDQVTRQMCSHTYLDRDFSLSVHQRFVAERLRAHGLPLGIDLVALVRHARRAQQLHTLRDALLSVCLVALVAAVVGGVGAVTAWDGGRALDCLRLAGYALLAGVLLVYGWGMALWAAAHAVYWGERPPRESALPVDGGIEAELGELDEANVVPYATSVGSGHPFVGSGVMIAETVWDSIDVGRPAQGGLGDRLSVKPFDAVALHTYVEEKAGDITGLDGLRARNRLYVRGRQARDLGADLLPDPLRRPLIRIKPGLVESGITETGAVMRTYLSLEMVAKGGAYVVTMYLRARLASSRLSWEVSSYVLPPVHAAYNTVFKVPSDGFERAWRLLGFTLKELRPQLLGSVGHLVRLLMRHTRNALRLWWDRRRIVRRQGFFDYGTCGTLRADAADLKRMAYIQRMDALDTLLRLQQGVLLATEQFLKDHNVDTSDLNRARKVINNQTNNFNGPINGQNNFGDHGTNFAGPGGPGPGGAEGGGGSAP